MKFTDLYRCFTKNRLRVLTDNGRYDVKIFHKGSEIFSIFDTENNIEDALIRFMSERWFMTECLKSANFNLKSNDYSLTISGYVKKTEEFK